VALVQLINSLTNKQNQCMYVCNCPIDGELTQAMNLIIEGRVDDHDPTAEWNGTPITR
jgi:hypothetical protein